MPQHPNCLSTPFSYHVSVMMVFFMIVSALVLRALTFDLDCDGKLVLRTFDLVLSSFLRANSPLNFMWAWYFSKWVLPVLSRIFITTDSVQSFLVFRLNALATPSIPVHMRNLLFRLGREWQQRFGASCVLHTSLYKGLQ